LNRILAFAAAFFLVAFSRAADVVVASYNLENYLHVDRRVDGRWQKNAGKPESEINALVQIIKEISPDILGVCEMGAHEEFDDFRKRLDDAGLGFKDFEYVQGADPERHLALLSRFPISSRQSLTDVSYQLNGQEEKVKRGFLDVTIRVTKNSEMRFIGAHLKSKLNDTPAGEALVRRNEAHQLRMHIDDILKSDPKARVLAYGDFNALKNEPPIEAIMGARNSPRRMTDLWLADKIGDHWTHYWKTADEYSRIDYFFASPALLPDVVKAKSGVYRSDYWNDASDHRAIFATFHCAE